MERGVLHTVIHVALGTANMLGLVNGNPLVRPHTAHFMNGGRCAYDCAYCTRARTSTASGEYLCRVPWPAHEERDVFSALGENEGEFSRICLQIVNSEGYIQVASKLIQEITKVSSLPISVEIRTRREGDVERLLDDGADYVGLPLDVASEELYPTLRGGSLKEDLHFLYEATESFTGRVGTHLIVGLGETEEEMICILRELFRREASTGLFAFTPCRGTKLENSDPPSLSQYRNIQLAKYLTESGRDEGISFDHGGRVSSFGLGESELSGIPNEIFETQGCEGCNRPYYNERPIGRPYNYPRELTESEFQTEIQETWK
jgi:biotin synthase